MRTPFLIVALLLLAHPAEAQRKAPPAPGLEKRVEAYLRKLYAWGPSYRIRLGPPAPAEVPGFVRYTVEVTLEGQSDTAVLYVSRDGRHLIRGEVLDTSIDPFAAARRILRTAGRPSRGPASARVTVIDFSDFQCPHCKQLDLALRHLVAQYPQVRFVSKQYPLSQIHPWAMTAATAAACAFRLRPEAYWTVHHAIFDQQEKITAENAWQTLQDIAASAGIDGDAMRACLAAPEPRQAVEDDLKEGEAVRIANTPTVFVNGRRLVGGDPSLLRQYIDYELAATSPKP